MTSEAGKSPKSGFQQWLEEHEGTTTLAQQVGLAQRLYHNACETPNTLSTTDATIEDLKQTPVLDRNEGLVSWTGINVGWFLNQFCRTPYMKQLQHFGCELWFVRKVCIIEMIRNASGHSSSSSKTLFGTFVHHRNKVCQAFQLPTDGVVAKPTTFVSYTGAYTLEYLVEVLHQLDPDEYIWMDLFCVDQFAWTGKGRSHEMHQFRETFMGELQESIGRIGQTALILKEWDNVMGTLEQIWVLWEVFNTAQAGANLTVLLPDLQIKRFVEGCLESTHPSQMESIQRSLSTIDANKAKAQEESDRTIIFGKIKEAGLSRVNTVVIQTMRNWLITVGQTHLSALQQGDNKPPSHAFLNNLGMLLQDQGNMQDAEPLVQQALTGRVRTLGRAHPDTLRSMFYLAAIYHNQGRLEEAADLYKESSVKSQNVLGLEHSFTITCLENYALLLKDQGNEDHAEIMMTQALTARRQVNGDHHPRTLRSMRNLGVILLVQGKLHKAEPLLRASLEGCRKQLGNNHSDTLIAINNMGMLLQSQGRLEESLGYLEEALARKRQLWGSGHPSTLISMHNLALLHVKMDAGLDKVEALLQEECGAWNSLNHPNAVRAAHALEVVRKHQTLASSTTTPKSLLDEIGAGTAVTAHHLRVETETFSSAPTKARLALSQEEVVFEYKSQEQRLDPVARPFMPQKTSTAGQASSSLNPVAPPFPSPRVAPPPALAHKQAPSATRPISQTTAQPSVSVQSAPFAVTSASNEYAPYNLSSQQAPASWSISGRMPPSHTPHMRLTTTHVATSDPRVPVVAAVQQDQSNMDYEPYLMSLNMPVVAVQQDEDYAPYLMAQQTRILSNITAMEHDTTTPEPPSKEAKKRKRWRFWSRTASK